MTLFHQMKRCINLTEALSPEERIARANRTAAASIVSHAVSLAVSKTLVSFSVRDVQRRRTADGYLLRYVFTGKHHQASATAINTLVRPVELALRRAGYNDAVVSVRNKALRVLIPRAEFARQPAPVEEEVVEMVDVTKPVTSSGSTKGMLPGHRKQAKKSALNALADELSDEDVELDEFGDPIEPTDKV
jgi:hypothetical protein